ncbi:TadE/TadG family type IV pilus assembly protein [Rhodopirellula sp. MGV]|uniref:TadE/TadG family type IV pilus assembly protein n=1 Tax=Rhodopirellula sp. MGV TaxID=2023130 RepID=UPI000B96931D|nr:TadE/TadG family type IV pilus assembly protein [Rhodopirellula sp. MGV]OYP34069.1 TadE-like protein [Rhodopirellula sp. MGV]PNY38370.1 pilus assembly protein [Rhodopirellula baltica]
MNRQKRSRRQAKRDRRGAAMVEFAIIANIFFVLVFTCMEFARMNMIRNLAQDAAYFAARKAIVPGATSREAIDAASEVMDMITTTGYEVTVNDLSRDTPMIEVTVKVDFNEIALFAPLFLPDAVIESTARMKTERYNGYYHQ